ncbi:MAG: hypothetical protein ACRD0Z_10545 [Acidimicrobiales bacterium]
MSISDYILDLALIGLVFLQLRGRRLTTRALVLPLVIVGIAAREYLHAIPTAGNDLVLIVGCAAVGSLLGSLCAVFTSVSPGRDGTPIAKAGAAAALLWVLGVGSRFAFQMYVTHGGEGALVRFSAAHQITSANAWVAAVLLMAFGEVAFRSGILAFRSMRLRRQAEAPGPSLVPAGGSIMGSVDGSV